MNKNILILFLLTSISVSCSKEFSDPQTKCHQGTVIGRIRTSGGGPAISLNDTDLSTHEWKGFENVVEALNMPDSLWQIGKKVFLFARPATKSERAYPVSADGDESAKPIIFVLKISTTKCPDNGN